MGQALTTASTMTCPHGATIRGVASGKLKAGGAAVLTDKDGFQIIGCTFTLPSGTPSPCLVIEWKVVDKKAKAGSGATLSTASVGLCKAGSGTPQGVVSIATTQAAVQTS
jgi:hypothetical protein